MGADTASFSRELLQQPSPEMLHISKFHRTRSGQVLDGSSFVLSPTPPKLRRTCVHTAIIFAIVQTSLCASVL